MRPEDSRLEHSRPVNVRRVIGGSAVVLVGVLCWLYQLDRISTRELLGFWPVALIALGLCQLIDPELKETHPNGLIPVLAGLLLLFGNQVLPDEHAIEIWLGLVQFRLSWPMVLVIAGSYIAWRDLSASRPLPGAES